MIISEETRALLKERGVYAIVNVADGKNTTYVGSTVKEFVLRLYTHRAWLRRNKHPNKHLQAAWNKYGEDSFEFQIIEQVENRMQILAQEQYWLDCYRVTVPVYNCGIVTSTPMLGRTQTEETRKKISKKLRGQHRQEEFGRVVAKRNRERVCSDATREKQSNVRRGQNHWTDYQRERVHETMEGNQYGAVTYPAMVNVYTGERIDSGRGVMGLCRRMHFNFPKVFDLLKERRLIYRGWILEKNCDQYLL